MSRVVVHTCGLCARRVRYNVTKHAYVHVERGRDFEHMPQNIQSSEQ